MSEESVKISRVKRSCKIIRIVTHIVNIIGIVASMIALVTGIVILTNAKNFEKEFHGAVEQAEANGDVKTGITVKVLSAESTHVEMADPSFLKFLESINIQSSNAAVQEYADKYPVCLVFGCYLLFIAVAVAIFAVVFHLISKTFELIEKEETPFTKKVAKRVMVTGIVLSAGLAMTSGLGIGAIGGLLTWCIYAIMDYGITLQTQADETL